MSTLKPFILNLNDIEYVLAQVNFIPLFDADGNAIIAWDGTGAIYNQDGTQLWNGTNNGYTPAEAQAIWGTSYAHITASQGIREVSGIDNNLLLVNRTWGAVDAEFVRKLGVNYGFLEQNYDAGATRIVPLNPDLTALNTQLGLEPASTTAASTILGQTDPQILTSTSIPGGADITYTIQYFYRTTQDVITSTHTISGGREFVSWNRVDIDTQQRTDLIVVDSTGEHVESSVAGPISQLTSYIFMSGGELDPEYHSFTAQDVQDSIAQGYAPTSVNGVATTAADFENGSLAADPDADVRLGNVIDYTPRMITQTITTAGADMLTVADLVDLYPAAFPGGLADLAVLGLSPNHIVYNTPFLNDGITANPAYTQGQDPNGTNSLGDNNFNLGAVDGIAIVQDYGLLAELGLHNNQNPDNDESYIGAINPGVAPTNGFFGIFGQFFDHGLDFISKNGQTDAGETAKIKIALAVDDPLYGVVGPDGRPTTEITITRATPEGIDANGAPLYINHTSPFVDQSQSYGSHDQIGVLLREWVEDPNNPGTYIPGTDLIDSYTLANAWTRWDGVETNQTLVSVNALRQHLIDTGRDDLSWEDIGNVRNRDATGHVDGTGTSGHALLLDMNPRFDGARMDAPDVAAIVDASVSALNAILQTAGPGATSLGTFSQNGNGDLQLDLAAGAMGPGSQAVTFTGASALAPFVNFADFSIQTTLFGIPGMAAVDHDAVSEILLASVGDHYLSGDGRVNENVGLTTIHHVFHEEHNFQVANIEKWILGHDDAQSTGPDDHAVASAWMTAITNTTTAITNANVAVVDGHYEATGGLLASDVNGDIYVVAAGTQNTNSGGANYDPNFVDFVRTPPTVDTYGNPQPGTPIDATGHLTLADGYLSWNLDKVFEGARLIVETEYNHVATDQFAGSVTPDIPEFVGYNSGRDASITLEFGQAAYRYGHSTLRETIDVIDPDGGLTSKIMSYALEAAFLKPELYAELGPDAITLGQTRQQMNEIDEFITPALNQGLLGLPLDLAAINIARGRDIGLPTFNEMRVALGFDAYNSWNDFGNNMQHGGVSLVNFIAAYALDGDVAQAQAILDASNGDAAAAADLLANYTDANGASFASAAAAMAYAVNFVNGGNQDVNKVDAWLGGISEVHVNGGLLGEVFNAIFVDQITALKDGDRFYYLYRLFGQEIDEQIKAEQFKDLVERTTGTSHLNGNVFGYAEQYHNFKLDAAWPSADYLYNADGDVLIVPGQVFDPGVTYYDENGVALTQIQTQVELYDANGTPVVPANGFPVAGTAYYDADGKFIGADQHKYGQLIAEHAGDANGLNLDGTVNYGVGIYSDGGGSTAENGTLLDFTGIMAAGQQKFILDIRTAVAGRNDQLDGEPGSGADAHEVIVGTDFDDVIYARAGDDTVYGEGGNDLIYGGNGADALYGGDGHDEIHGGDGPEVIDGGAGDDVIYGDSSESAAGGTDLLIGGVGNDIIYGGVGIDELIGNGGDDILFGGGDTDPFTRAGDGNDYLDGGAVGDILYGDAGDDLVVGGDDQDIVQGGQGDDILRPGRPSQALGGGPDEVLGGDGVTDTGFDLLELNDFDPSPNGETVDLENQANPLAAVDGVTPQAAMTQVEGIIGTLNDDTLIGNRTIDAGIANTDNNWFIGGSGDDTFIGHSGNDVIIGGSIRLDALIGRYEVTPGTRAAYESYDAYEGASHRVDPTVVLSDGLLGNAAIGTEMFDLHFTQFLKTDMYKDYVLGNSTVVFDPLNPELSGTAAADTGNNTAVYNGNFDQYTLEYISFIPAGSLQAISAIKITDNRTAADFLDGNGDPLLDANGDPLVNEGTDLVVGVADFQFADQLWTIAPEVALVGQFVNENVADNFSPSNTYDGNDGTMNWAGGWVEALANGNPADNGGLGGDITIANTGGFGGGNNQLNFNSGVVSGEGIQRAVDLSGAQSATLTFNWSESQVDTGENILVQAFNGSTWDTIGTLLGDSNSGASGTFNMALTGAHLGAHSAIRFEYAEGAAGSLENNENFYIDNVSIAYSGLAPFAQNFAANYIEGDGAAQIADMAVITDNDGATLESGLVVLTNAVAGQDNLSLDGLAGSNGVLSSGIAYNIVNAGNEIRIEFTGTASHADYQNAIDLVRYENSVSGPAVSPDGTPRVIEVTVFDGTFHSAVATSTIDVVPVDAPVANADIVLTNITDRSAISISNAALFANDTDANGDPLAVSSTANATGGSVNNEATVFTPTPEGTLVSNTYGFAGVTAASAAGGGTRAGQFEATNPFDNPLDTLAAPGTFTANLNNAAYTSISTSDNVSFTTIDPGFGDNAVFWAEFDISETPSTVTELTYTIEARQIGSPANDEGLDFGIFNYTTGSWDTITEVRTLSDFTFQVTQTANVEQYIGAGGKVALVLYNEDDENDQQQIAVDNVNLQVTHLEPPVTPTPFLAGSFEYVATDVPPIGPASLSNQVAVTIEGQVGNTVQGTGADEILIGRDGVASASTFDVSAAVAGGSTFNGPAGNNQFTFTFEPSTTTESITQIQITLPTNSNFDIAGANSKAFTLGSNNQVAVQSTSVTNNDHTLTIDFAPGAFNPGDTLAFGIDLDGAIGNGEDLGSAGVPFSVTFSNGATADGAYATGPGNSSVGSASGTVLEGSTLNGDGGNDYIVGGSGNDIIDGGAGDDAIAYSVTGGRDIVDGGANASATSTGDTFVVNGTDQSETFNLFTRADWIAAGNDAGDLDLNTQIIIALNGTTNSAIIAELRNIEEIIINTMGGDDTVNVSGNFDQTSLNYNTITINGSDDDDTVNIEKLMSEHRVVFHGMGGMNHVIGDVRPQDVIENYEHNNNPDQSGMHYQDGGGDDDHMEGSEDDDHMDGHDGDDEMMGNEGNDEMHGGGGNDTMCGGLGDDLIFGGDQDDVLCGNDGNDVLFGGNGNDTLYGDNDYDALFGDDGNDLMFGGTGNDRMFGGGDNDRMFGQDGDDLMRGDDGNDVMNGGAGNDRMYGDYGVDRMYGGSGNDGMFGGHGTDRMYGGSGNDAMHGGSQADYIFGQSGNDRLFGDDGNDRMFGNGGNDMLTGGHGRDIMNGGTGRDKFRYESINDSQGTLHDLIRGFERGVDDIDLRIIDASTKQGGNQAFTFIGDNAFSNTAGELHTVRVGGMTRIEGDTDGDGNADLIIDVTGTAPLTAQDFHL